MAEIYEQIKNNTLDSGRSVPGSSSCDDSGGARISQYLIGSRKDGDFVLFSVASNMKTDDAKAVAKEERLADFRKAALVAVDH